MVDNRQATTQFHPYSSPEATPVAAATAPSTMSPMWGSMPSGESIVQSMKQLLGRVRGTHMPDMKAGRARVGDSIEKMRGMAAANPGVAIGALSALVIGAGMMSRRHR